LEKWLDRPFSIGVVGVDREFPANIYPWMGLKRKGVELRLYRPNQGRMANPPMPPNGA